MMGRGGRGQKKPTRAIRSGRKMRSRFREPQGVREKVGCV